MEDKGVGLRMETKVLEISKGQLEVAQLRMCKGEMTELTDKTKDPELWKKYSEIWQGKVGNVKVEMQLATNDPNVKRDMLGDEDGIVARVWFTEKSKTKPGEGDAVCYLVGESGKLYKRTAQSYSYDAKLESNLWNWGKPVEVDGAEKEVMFTQRLNEMRAQKTREVAALK
jgi:hypothetical protein